MFRKKWFFFQKDFKGSDDMTSNSDIILAHVGGESLSLSLTLSLTHTHTHTHTLSFFSLSTIFVCACERTVFQTIFCSNLIGIGCFLNNHENCLRWEWSNKIRIVQEIIRNPFGHSMAMVCTVHQSNFFFFPFFLSFFFLSFFFLSFFRSFPPFLYLVLSVCRVLFLLIKYPCNNFFSLIFKLLYLLLFWIWCVIRPFSSKY
jgi:hypothetical protein